MASNGGVEEMMKLGIMAVQYETEAKLQRERAERAEARVSALEAQLAHVYDSAKQP